MPLEVEEVEFDVDSVLTNLGYASDRIQDIKKSDVLLLPKELDSSESIFVDASVAIKKVLETKLKVTPVMRQGAKHHYYAQRHAEIVIPLLVFFGPQALDIGKGIIAAWLYDRLPPYKGKERQPNTKLEWIYINEEKGIKRMLKYEGPTEPLPNLLNRLNVED